MTKRMVKSALFAVILGITFLSSQTAFASPLLSDTFTTGTTIDSTKWTVYDPAGTSITQSSGLHITNSNAGNISGLTYVASQATFPNTNVSVSAKVTGGSGSMMGYGDPQLKNVYFFYADSSTVRLYHWIDGTGPNLSCGSYTSGATYTLTVNPTGATVFANTGSGDVQMSCTYSNQIGAQVSPNNQPVFFQSINTTTSSAATWTNVTVQDSVSAPIGATISATPGDTQMGLSWTAPFNGNSAITDYLVEYKRTVDSSWTTFTDGVSATPSATVTGLTDGTSYDFRVSAINAVGTSLPGPVITSTVDPIASGSGTIFSDTFTGSTIDATKWNVTDGAGTNISQNGNVSVKNSFSTPNWDQTALVSAKNFSNGSLNISAQITPGSGTTSAVMGYGDANFTSASGQAYLLTMKTNGQYSASFYNNGVTSNTELCGSASAGATLTMSLTPTGFRTYANGALGCEVTVPFQLNNKPIFFQSDTANASTFDTVAVTNTQISLAGAPNSLTALSGDAQANLQWTAPNNNGGPAITDYLVEYKRTVDSSWTTFTDGVSTATTTTVTGLTNGTSYDFRVSAITAVATSGPSVIATVTPGGQTISVVAVGMSGSVALQWTGIDNATNYVIEYKKTSDSSWTTFNNGTSTNKGTTVTGLTNDTSYDFRVSAVVGGVTGFTSTPVTTTPSATSNNASGQSIPATDDEFIGPFDSWLNAKTNFGAVGDGVTDDTAALQAAFDAVATQSQQSTTLFIPSGTYLISSSLIMSHNINVSVIGEDPATTIIKWGGSAGGTMMQNNGTRYSKFDRLTFDGQNVASIDVDQSWDGVSSNFDTGNEYADDAFINAAFGIRGGALGHGFAEVTILRDKFTNDTSAGVSLGNFNALDVWVRDSVFENCARGVTNSFGAGNYKVYNNIFRGSTVSDLSTGNTGEFSVRDNTSTGSNQFFAAAFSRNPGATTLQGNTILDSTATQTITVSQQGPVTLLDNTIRPKSSVTVGPLVGISGTPDSDAVVIGNTFGAPSPLLLGNYRVEYNNTVVSRASLASLGEQTLPPTEPNFHRQIFEVTRGASASAIQTVINQAALASGSRPVVHFPAGTYNISNTLFVPQGSDMQLVGDEAGQNFGTKLNWSGAGVGPMLSIAGPSKATIKDIAFTGSTSSTNILITNVDQPGARVYLQQFLQISGQIGLLSNQLDHTLVIGHDTGFSGMKKAISAVGGPHAAAGSPDEGRTIIYDGAESNNYISHQVTNGGNLTIQDSWYEGSINSIYADLSGKGIFTATGDHISTQQYKDVPSMQINNFSGKATFMADNMTDRFAITGDGSGAKVLGIGNLFEDDPVVSDTSSPSADIRLLVNRARDYNSGVTGSGSYVMPDTGVNDQSFISSMISNIQNVHDTDLTSLADGVSDVRIFRVMSLSGAKGLDLEAGSNILNTSPIVNAGIDQTISVPVTHTTLVGSATDPDGSISSYRWSQVSGPASATFTAQNSATTTINGLSTAGTYVFSLSALDNGGASSTSNVNVIVSPTPDTTPPNIVNPSVTSQTNSTASILWTTNEPASSQIQYGTSVSYGTNTAVTDTAPYVLSHIVNLTGLSACTTYHFVIVSLDASDNSTTSNDGSVTTTGCSSGGGGGGSGGSISGGAGGGSGPVTPPVTTPVTTPGGTLSPGCNQGDAYSATTGLPCNGGFVGGGVKFIFKKVLKVGVHSPDAAQVQYYLNTHGFPVAPRGVGSLGKETTYFGPATKSSLMKYQAAHAADILTPIHLKKPTGIFGAMSVIEFNKGL